MKKISLNKEWLFYKDGQEETATVVNVPHDAMLTEERVPDLENGSASGFYPGGKYIYVKKLFGEEVWKDKTMILEFEGIYMDSTILLNGEVVGGRLYGYSNFFVDITGKVRIGQENELKVIADNSKTPNSRWYSGSGIYRPVNLYLAGTEFIQPEGVRITTTNYCPAILEVQVEAVAGDDVTVVTNFYEGEQKVAEIRGLSGVCEIPDAKLWSADEPYMYRVVTELFRSGQLLDREECCYGIRMISWNAEQGLLINGNAVKLKGGCVHHDNGPLGGITNNKAELRKIRKMKELGYNAVRYSHYPAGKNFLDICDRLGMYVMDETFDQWKIPQTTYDYASHFDTEWEQDLVSLIGKDYNHPSVIMYCIGNEITDTGLPHGAMIAKMLVNKVKELDVTRPTTIAINGLLTTIAAAKAAQATVGEETGEKQVGSQEVNDIITLLAKISASVTAESLEALIHDIMETVDIAGYNYGENLYEGIHQLAPDRVIVSSETFPARLGEHWPMIHDNAHIIGDFMWTAWDYLGEAGVGMPYYGATQAPFSKSYPCLTAACGSIDLTGYVESQGRYTSVIFGTELNPCIAVRPLDHAGEEYTVGRWRLTDAVDSWSWPGCEGKIAEIEVYSIGAEVELQQDGISLGRTPLVNYVARFETEYKPGMLTAISYDEEGKRLGEIHLCSADNTVTRLTIKPEETEILADEEDLAYINIMLTDENGIVKQLLDQQITVTVEGAGKLVALASANPETINKFSDMMYTSYHGRLLAIVQSTGERGEIRITAEAEGLPPESTVINAG